MKTALLTLLLLLASSACNQEYHWEIRNIENRILALGHGGMGFTHTYPTNSYEAIRRCLEEGADGSEIDVQMSADGVLIAFHDNELDITTNFEGSISNYTFEELQECRYDKKPMREYRVISIQQLIDNIPMAEGHYYSLDCKTYYDHIQEPTKNILFAQAIVAFIHQNQKHGTFYVESHIPELLQEIRRLDPLILLFIYAHNLEEAFEMMKKVAVEGVIMDAKNINKEEVAQLHEQGILVALYGGNSYSSYKKIIQMNPDIIQGDDLPLLVKLLK